MKGSHLRSPMSKEEFLAKLAATPQAGDQVEAPPPLAEPKIGDKMSDGTIYAGISPRTNRPMYATAVDAPLTMTFQEATDYAAQLDAHGHRDWRLPTKTELNELFNNRAAIGGFNLTGAVPAGWYWSSSQKKVKWSTWSQRFRDGFQYDRTTQGIGSSLRCVR
jgi:hypothetical protein